MTPTAQVMILLDGEPVTAQLLSSPSAIGVCTIRVRGEDLVRHTSRIEPLDDEARRLLALGDSFVRRNPDTLLGVAAKDTAAPRPKDWTIADLEMLRLYSLARQQEAQRRLSAATARHRGRARRTFDDALLSMKVVSLWLKQARMERTAVEAGLSEEDARDPLKLLRAAQQAIWQLRDLYRERTGESAPDKTKRVADAINNYFAHHADPRAASPTAADVAELRKAGGM